jgi:transposase
MTRPGCTVPRCDQPPRWVLEDENQRTWLVCGKHLDAWTTYLHNRYRAACTQHPYQPGKRSTPAKTKPASTLF